MTTRTAGIALALACAIVITPSICPAQESARPNRPDRFRGLDTDGDGKMSFAEAKAAYPNLTQETFDERDRNGDGFWTPEDREDRDERPGPPTPGMPRGGRHFGMMPRMDTNGDGKISFEEAKAARPGLTEEVFKQRDRNGDGYWSREDWTGPFPAPSTSAASPPVSPGESPSGDTPRRESRLSRMDTDGDGKISFEEAQAARPGITKEMFKQRDRNGDGFWSAEDWPRRRANPAPPSAQAPPVVAEPAL